MSSTPRTWLVTGASSGFGLEIARIAIHRGDRVVATSRNPDKIPKDDINSDRLHTAQLDHNQPFNEVKAALDKIINQFGPIDIVVNNAAYVQTGTVEETTPEETLQQFQANTFGPMNVYRAILPYMRLAGEVEEFGIRHCLVEPGFFRTGLLDPSANITGSTVRIADYNKINATIESNLNTFNGSQLGNPVKGAEVIYDVVTSTGCAAGRELPCLLPLGSDACDEISKAANKVLGDVESWKNISVLSDFPQGS